MFIGKQPEPTRSSAPKAVAAECWSRPVEGGIRPLWRSNVLA
jgi:hypothetical protein